jgi:hypothetical protein
MYLGHVIETHLWAETSYEKYFLTRQQGVLQYSMQCLHSRVVKLYCLTFECGMYRWSRNVGNYQPTLRFP